jgi:hypothetical protein
MSVAPSFVNFEMLGGPYQVNGKMYIRVRNPKTRTERQVRWYEETKTVPVVKEVNTATSTQKEALGFKEGYITIFKGDTGACLDWFQLSIARYCKWWGWYIVSTDEIPNDIPKGIECLRLDWDDVGTEAGSLKSDAEIRKHIDTLMYESDNSNFVGSVGERLELIVTVVEAKEIETQRGHSIMFNMVDKNENKYIWTTSSKSWSAGEIKHIKGTVKEHSTFRNSKITVLTRCMEVK